MDNTVNRMREAYFASHIRQAQGALARALDQVESFVRDPPDLTYLEDQIFNALAAIMRCRALLRQGRSDAPAAVPARPEGS